MRKWEGNWYVVMVRETSAFMSERRRLYVKGTHVISVRAGDCCCPHTYKVSNGMLSMSKVV